MTRLLVILMVALILEAVGVVLLSHGLKQMGPVTFTGLRDLPGLLGRGLAQPTLLLGVLLETIFFGTLLYLLSQADVSVVWPLTALGFVLTTLSAKWLLHEEVSPVRWTGVILIVVGAMLVSWSAQPRKGGPLVTSAEQSPTSRPR